MREGKEWLNIISEKGRSMRTVCSIGTTGIKEAHFSTFPLKIARRCILAGCPISGTVLDIFLGSGTTLLAAKELNMHGIRIELVAESVKIAEKRLLNTQYKLKLNGE